MSRPCEPTFNGALSCMNLIDEQLPGVSALVVHNEAALSPLLGILRAAGRRVPQDVSVVAICPQDVALGLPIRMTSVDIPRHQLGALAVERVMSLLRGDRGAETRLLAPRLLERDSCTAAAPV